jgi:hypothetical protein
MKKLLIVACAVVGMVTASYAQDTTSTPTPQGDPVMRQSSDELQRNLLTDMVKIPSTELPEGVKKAVEGAAFKGAKTFFKHKEKDEYAVEVRSGEVSSFNFFDEEGHPINKRENK